MSKCSENPIGKYTGDNLLKKGNHTYIDNDADMLNLDEIMTDNNLNEKNIRINIKDLFQ